MWDGQYHRLTYGTFVLLIRILGDEELAKICGFEKTVFHNWMVRGYPSAVISYQLVETVYNILIELGLRPSVLEAVLHEIELDQTQL